MVKRIAAAICTVFLLIADILFSFSVSVPMPVEKISYTLPEVTVSDITPAAEEVSPSDDPVPSEPSPSDTENEIIEYDIRFPYFISLDKVGRIVTFYTTNEEGKYEIPVRQCICSVGADICNLPDGVYQLKGTRNRWEKLPDNGEALYAQYATKLTGSVIFHSVPYTAEEKSALDTRRFENLGKLSGGGYVRLTVECAKWIYDNCPAGTPVRVFSATYDATLIEKLTPPLPENGWDPTDPDPENPAYKPQYNQASEPKPFIYTPVYEYDWQFAPECRYAFFDGDDN